MTVNESAVALGNAIQNTTEFQDLKKLYSEVQADDATKGLFERFRNMQLDMQQKQMAGQEITQEEIGAAQIIVSDVQQNELISKLMQAEEKLNNVILQINQIVLKPLEDLYSSVQ
ncbi:YlbF family regulator [Niallia sp. Krafla_26]|uniref:YlbF family regulator n=1 Tax=Niallia sp. Krafla_26 TaxID=3064703 RepID=UPI003D169A91